MYAAFLRSFQRNDTDENSRDLKGGDEKRVVLYRVNGSSVPDSDLVPETGLPPEIGLVPGIGAPRADWIESSCVA